MKKKYTQTTFLRSNILDSRYVGRDVLGRFFSSPLSHGEGGGEKGSYRLSSFGQELKTVAGYHGQRKQRKKELEGQQMEALLITEASPKEEGSSALFGGGEWGNSLDDGGGSRDGDGNSIIGGHSRDEMIMKWANYLFNDGDNNSKDNKSSDIGWFGFSGDSHGGSFEEGLERWQQKQSCSKKKKGSVAAVHTSTAEAAAAMATAPISDCNRDEALLADFGGVR